MYMDFQRYRIFIQTKNFTNVFYIDFPPFDKSRTIL